MNSNQKTDIACIAHIAVEKCNCPKCKPLREVRQKCEAGTASPDVVLCLAEIDRLNLAWQKTAQEVGDAAVRCISILEADINRLAKERDAALTDMKHYMMSSKHPCQCCKYYEPHPIRPLSDWESCRRPTGNQRDKYICWEWRGLQEEGE